jgi:hypothetical protein
MILRLRTRYTNSLSYALPPRREPRVRYAPVQPGSFSATGQTS